MRPQTPSIFYRPGPRSGIGQALISILLVIMGIALLSIVFAFGNVLVQTGSRSAGIDILDLKLVKLSTSTVMRISVGNVGTETLTLTEISIEGTSCRYSLSQPLKPGQTFSETYLCAANLRVGERYAVLVKANADSRTVTDIGSAIVEA